MSLSQWERGKTFFKADARPAKLEKADRVKARESLDAAESKKVKARSGGRCEIGEAHSISEFCGLN